MKHVTPYIFAGMLAFGYPAIAETPHSNHPDAGTNNLSSSSRSGINSETRRWESEKKYWQDSYKSRPYYREGDEYTRYEPAYRYGLQTYNGHAGKSFDELDSAELQKGWDSARGSSDMTWDEAKDAVRDSYEHPRSNDSAARSRTSSTADGETTSY